jgi:MFS family permease
MAPNGILASYIGIFVAGYLPTSGFSSSDVALVLGVEGLTAITAAIPLGILSDRKGRKSPMISGNLLAGLASMLLFASRGLYSYVFAAFLFGIAEASVLSTWNAIIADGTDITNRTKAFSLTFILSSFSSSVGFALPFVFPYVESIFMLTQEKVHYLTLLILATANILSTLFMAIILRNYRERPHIPVERKKEELSHIFKLALSNSIIAFGAGLIIPFVPTWLLHNFGLPDSVSGPVLAIGGLTISFGAGLSPRLASRLGIVRGAALTTASSLTFMFLLAFIKDAYLAVIIYVVRTMLMNMSNPLIDTLVMNLTRSENRGFVSALVTIMWRLPNSISTIFAAFLLRFVNFDALWLVASFFYAIGITIFYVYFRAQKF